MDSQEPLSQKIPGVPKSQAEWCVVGRGAWVLGAEGGPGRASDPRGDRNLGRWWGLGSWVALCAVLGPPRE